MRDLLISTAIIVVLIGSWLCFDSYSNNSIKDLVNDIQEDIIPAVESEDWEKSRRLTEELSEEWHEYKKVALLFLSTEELSEIDYCIARSEKYVDAADISNSSGELNSLAEQMKFLISREKVSLENIL